MVVMMKTSESRKVFDQEFMPLIDDLYNYAFRYIRTEAEANDLVQDTMLKAWTSIESYRQGTNAKAWLFTILKNLFINDYRKKARRGRQVDYEEVVTFRDGETNANLMGYLDMRYDLYDQLLEDELMEALDRLPEDFREVLLLADRDDWKYDEIAEFQQVPIGTVRSRLFRARNLLAKELEDYARERGIQNKRK